MKEILKSKVYSEHEFPFFRYIAEDKSIYPSAKSKGFDDPDDDFLVGKSGGFLMNIDWIFINTHQFSITATNFERNGYYCKSKKGSPDYIRFWAEETYRRKYGITKNCKLLLKDIPEYFNPNTSDSRKKELLKPLRITGDHYSFLNYGRIFRALRPDERAAYTNKRGKVPKKKFGFPNFIDGQYWNFKIDEFIYNNGYHLCKSKARRKGFSYMRGHQAASTMNLNKDITVILAAYELAYLTEPGATTDMVKRNLDWFEQKTYWKRGYLSEDYSNIELGYKKKKGGNTKFGFKSKLLSVGCRNNESAVVGKDIFEADFEEAGKFRNLAKVLEVTTSAAEDGDSKVGTIRIYGTGGSEESNWEAFSKVFFNPSSNEMMPFENVWDDDLRHTTCGFFFPQVWAYGSYVDEHGNSLLLDAYKHDADRKEEYESNNTPAKSIVFRSQRANKPSEAFLNTTDNLFASPELNKWIIRLKYDPDVNFYKDGMPVDTGKKVVFKTNEQLKALGIRTSPYIEDVPITPDTNITGCMRMFFEPYTIDGKIPDDLYFITSDSVGIDKDKKELTIRHSLNSFKIWMIPDVNSPYPHKRLVASYCGRYNTLKEYDDLLFLASVLYNAKILPEVNRGETLANFSAKKQLSRILKDPRGLISKGRYAGNTGLGMVIGEQDTKLEGLRMLKEILYTKMNVDANGKHNYFLHYIYDLPFLLELQNFSLVGNFDRISDAILAAFHFKALEIKAGKSSSKRDKGTNGKLLNRLLYAN